MSQVDKLIAKALSTSSEEEALSALRLARKRHTQVSTIEEKSANIKTDTSWKVKAEYFEKLYRSTLVTNTKNYRAAVMLNVELGKANNICTQLQTELQIFRIALCVSIALNIIIFVIS
jgi:hypothetical protein